MSWPLLLGISGFLVVVGLGLGLADPDVYLHVAVGRWMLAHVGVPTRDPFSFTMHGAPWVAQEWGAELISVALYDVSGWSGLVFFGAACFGATLAYLNRFLLRRMEPLHALLLSCLAAGMMLPYMIDRPHAFVWPLTVIWVGTLVQASEQNRRPPWWLLGVMLLWVNMHASFILGLGVMLLLAIDALETHRGLLSSTVKRWGSFCALAFGVSLINPQGYRLLVFPFHVLDITEMLGHFKDWRPPDLQHLQVLDIWLIVVIGTAFAGRMRLSLSRACALVGLLYIALQSNRNVALLGLISPLLLARPVAAGWRRPLGVGKDARWLDLLFKTLAQPASTHFAGVSLATACAVAVVFMRLKVPAPSGFFAPSKGLQAIMSKVAQPRIFNDVNFGDYMIFRGVPVFIDARADMYGQKVLKRTFSAMALVPGGNFETLSKEYRINSILLWSGEPVVRLLNRMPTWQRIYQDQWTVAYIRRERKGP